MNIGLDIDGVVYDWHGVVYTYFRSEKGYEGTFSEFWTDYFKSLPDRTQEYYCNLDLFYDRDVPTVKLITFLNSLATNNDIYYITARPKSSDRITARYFERYQFPYYNNIIFSGHNKSDQVRLLSIDVFVDDNPKVVESLQNITKPFLLRKPWNRVFCDTFNCLDSIFDLVEVL